MLRFHEPAGTADPSPHFGPTIQCFWSEKMVLKNTIKANQGGNIKSLQIRVVHFYLFNFAVLLIQAKLYVQWWR